MSKKNREKLGRGEREGGGGGEERNFLPSPHPLPLLLIFRNLSQFSSPSRAFGKGKETAATQARIFLFYVAPFSTNNVQRDSEFCFCFLVIKYSSCRGSRGAKVTTFSLFYVKRQADVCRFT